MSILAELLCGPRCTAPHGIKSDICPCPGWAIMMSWARCLDAVQRVEDRLWKPGKANLGITERSPGLPSPADISITSPGKINPLWNLVEKIMSPGLHICPERGEVVKSCGASGIFQKICAWGTSWKRKSHIPGKLWAFCSVTGIWDGINSPWLQFWLNGVWRCAGGWRWVPGPMHRLAQPNVGGHDAQAGEQPCAAIPGKEPEREGFSASILCAQEALTSEPAAYERESFFRETTWTFCWNNSSCWVTWNV